MAAASSLLPSHDPMAADATESPDSQTTASPADLLPLVRRELARWILSLPLLPPEGSCTSPRGGRDCAEVLPCGWKRASALAATSHLWAWWAEQQRARFPPGTRPCCGTTRPRCGCLLIPALCKGSALLRFVTGVPGLPYPCVDLNLAALAALPRCTAPAPAQPLPGPPADADPAAVGGAQPGGGADGRGSRLLRLLQGGGRPGSDVGAATEGTPPPQLPPPPGLQLPVPRHAQPLALMAAAWPLLWRQMVTWVLEAPSPPATFLLPTGREPCARGGSGSGRGPCAAAPAPGAAALPAASLPPKEPSQGLWVWKRLPAGPLDHELRRWWRHEQQALPAQLQPCCGRAMPCCACDLVAVLVQGCPALFRYRPAGADGGGGPYLDMRCDLSRPLADASVRLSYTIQSLALTAAAAGMAAPPPHAAAAAACGTHQAAAASQEAGSIAGQGRSAEPAGGTEAATAPLAAPSMPALPPALRWLEPQPDSGLQTGAADWQPSGWPAEVAPHQVQQPDAAPSRVVAAPGGQLLREAPCDQEGAGRPGTRDQQLLRGGRQPMSPQPSREQRSRDQQPKQRRPGGRRAGSRLLQQAGLTISSAAEGEVPSAGARRGRGRSGAAVAVKAGTLPAFWQMPSLVALAYDDGPSDGGGGAPYATNWRAWLALHLVARVNPGLATWAGGGTNGGGGVLISPVVSRYSASLEDAEAHLHRLWQAQPGWLWDAAPWLPCLAAALEDDPFLSVLGGSGQGAAPAAPSSSPGAAVEAAAAVAAATAAMAGLRGQQRGGRTVVLDLWGLVAHARQRASQVQEAPQMLIGMVA